MLDALAPIQSRHANLTWADLIVLAGTVALADAGGVDVPYCPGRADAADADGTAHLAPRAYTSPAVAVRDAMDAALQDVAAYAHERALNFLKGKG